MTLPFELKKSAGKFEQDFIRAQFGLEVSHGDLPHESPHSKTHSKLHHYVEEAKHLSHHSHHVIHHSHHIKPLNPHLEKGAKPAADVYKKSNENDEEDKAEIKPAGKKKEVIEWDSANENYDPSYEVFGMESAESEMGDETFKLLHGDTHTHVYDSNGDYVGKFRKIGNYSANTVTTAKGQLARINGKLAFRTTSRQKVLADNSGGVLNHVGSAFAGGVAAIGGKMYYDHQKKGEEQ